MRHALAALDEAIDAAIVDERVNVVPQTRPQFLTAGVDRFGRAEEPIERIEIVDAQVEHRAAAPCRVEEPVGPGWKLREPCCYRRNRGTEAPAVDEFDQRHIFAPETEDMRHDQRSARLLRRRDHAVAVGGGQRERLFKQDVLAGLKRCNRRLAMEMRG